MVDFERVLFTLEGARSHHIHSPCFRERSSTEFNQNKKYQYLLPALWYAPDHKTAVREMRKIKNRLGAGNNRVRSGVAVFVRTLGDVLDPPGYDFDTSSLDGLLEASIEEQMPVFINTSGIQWTEVHYNESPLIKYLMSDTENRVILADGTPAPRIRQPPGRIWDPNGLSYLSMFAPEVERFWNKNIKQLADRMAEFADDHPHLFLGMCTENETDLPGTWAGQGQDSDYNPSFRKAFKSSETENWEEFRVNAIQHRNGASAAIMVTAGIPAERIYTHVSTEDSKSRASPIEVGIVPGAKNLGVVWWRGHHHNADMHLAARAAEREGRGWGILASNSLSFNPDHSRDYLNKAFQLGAKVIAMYCWHPHFIGYGIKGMPLEQAAREILSVDN